MRRLLAILLLLLAMVCCMDAAAQNVERQGNTFVQKKSGRNSVPTKTSYVYTDTKGNSYPVYLSPTGKAYTIKVSKKTGKEYKQYVPEIGKKINPNAYKEK